MMAASSKGRAGMLPAVTVRRRVLRLVLLLPLLLLSQTAVSTNGEPVLAQEETVSVSQRCIAQLLLEVTASTANKSTSEAFPDASAAVNKFVENCLGAEIEGGAFRALRWLVYRGVEQFLAAILGQFREATGFEVVMEHAADNDIAEEIKRSAQTSPTGYYDGWLAHTSVMVELYTQSNYVELLDKYIEKDSGLLWSDVVPYVRKHAMSFAGRTVGMPVAGKIAVLLYRRDVFTGAGLAVPTTWDDVVEAARILNGTDMDGDGEGDFSMCLQLTDSNSCPVQVHTAGQVLASMTQSNGTMTHWLFDPDTLDAFVDSPAMLHALEIYAQLAPYTPAGVGCNVLAPKNLAEGKCAFSIEVDASFKGLQVIPNNVKGKIGTAELPGSTHVLDRSTNTLVECDPERCPFARMETTYGGLQRLVNRAPHFGLGGITCMVNALQDPAFKQPIYELFSYMASPRVSRMDLLHNPAMGPFRYSHFDVSNASLAEWGAAGYIQEDVKEFLQASFKMIDSPNIAMELRIVRGSEYLMALGRSIGGAWGGMELADVQAQLVADFRAILADSGPRAQVLATFREGLGFERTAAQPSPRLELPPKPGSDDDALAVVLGVVLSVAVVLASVLAVYFVLRRHHRSLLGRPLMPQPGDETTLAVTDIMDSTSLWEALPSDVMSRTLMAHHAIVRKLLSHHCGYEQATEGDSFLLAFHTPSSAVEFAVALQSALLEHEWEPQLLSHPAAAPVGYCMSEVVRSAGASERELNLARAREIIHALSGAVARNGAAVGTDASAGLLASRAESEFNTVASIQQNERAGTLEPLSYGLLARRASSGPSDGSNRALRLNMSPRRAPNSPFGEAGLRPTSLVNSNASLQSAVLSNTVGEELADACALLQRITKAVPASLNCPEIISSSELERDEALKRFTVGTFLRTLGYAKDAGPGVAADALAPPSWLACTVGNSGKQTSSPIFNGLRVRVGLHSGVAPHEMEKGMAADGRWVYTGIPMALAKAVGDAADGGMVVMTQACFQRLARTKQLADVLVLCMGMYRLEGGSVEPTCIYQAVESSMVPRLSMFSPLRKSTQLETSFTDAPLAQATVVYANMVGSAILQTWDRDKYDQALRTFASIATRLLKEAGGYLVELTLGGLCLATFTEPLHAVAWSVCLVEALKAATWDEELLTHELCEPMLVPEHGHLAAQLDAHATELEEVSQHGPRQLHRNNLSRAARQQFMFRGPRMKVGIDRGEVVADASVATGRLIYRGKVMNRAARIAAQARLGEVWCSEAAWSDVRSCYGHYVKSFNLSAHPVGSFVLKGITGNVDLMQCTLTHGFSNPRCRTSHHAFVSTNQSVAARPSSAQELSVQLQLSQPAFIRARRPSDLALPVPEPALLAPAEPTQAGDDKPGAMGTTPTQP